MGLSSRFDGLAPWLQLSLTPGLGPRRIVRLLQAFADPVRALRSTPARLAPLLGANLADAVLAGDDARALAVERNLAWAAQPGCRLLTLADDDYPRRLLDLADPPPLLWVRGDARLLAQSAIAIVGSRQATRGGERHAGQFARVLGDAGLVIVSGLALGIDAAAHRGGLASRASSVAVVGNGLDEVYPRRHRELAEALAAHGAILSEFAIGTPPLPENFPRRNRLIAALSQGVLVIEAARGSGSLITAQSALDIGREVFAVPGSIDSAHSKGCHWLIKQGARLVEQADDVLSELTLCAGKIGHTVRTPDGSDVNAADHSDDVEAADHAVDVDGAGVAHDAKPAKAALRAGEQSIDPAIAVDAVAYEMLEALGWDPITIDEVSMQMKLGIADVQSRVMLLELAGRLERFDDGRVRRLS